MPAESLALPALRWRCVNRAAGASLFIGLILESQKHFAIHSAKLATSLRHIIAVSESMVANDAINRQTFPLPWPPGCEPHNSTMVEAIARAASDLVSKRDAWLNPPGANAEDLMTRTLTNLYNARPTWLAEAHRKLDDAVFAAYGWPAALSDTEILEQLLNLNRERAMRTT